MLLLVESPLLDIPCEVYAARLAKRSSCFSAPDGQPRSETTRSYTTPLGYRGLSLRPVVRARSDEGLGRFDVCRPTGWLVFFSVALYLVDLFGVMVITVMAPEIIERPRSSSAST